MSNVCIQTELSGLKLLRRGKVRDLYEYGDKILLIATDRISAFDVVLPTPIPMKGAVLTQLSQFWFDMMRDLGAQSSDQHRRGRISRRPAEVPGCFALAQHAFGSGGNVCRRVRRPRLPGRFRLEGIPGERLRLRHQAACRTAGMRPVARADFHAGNQSRVRARHQHFVSKKAPISLGKKTPPNSET